MTNRVYNFSAGPAMLPTPVMQKVQEEILDYQGLGASIVEVSHRLPIFREILDSTESMFRELTNLPKKLPSTFHAWRCANAVFCCSTKFNVT